MMKKFFAILMIVTMVVCYMPTVAFADSGNTQEPPTNATGDDCVEQENPDYSTLINDCDFTFYCTPGGGIIEEVYWDKDISGRKIFPMAAPPLVEGGYCKFKATPSKGWVFNEWKHEISRDALGILKEWRDENTSWTITKVEDWKPVKYTRYAFSTNDSEIELRRGPSKGETISAKLHYVVHAHFNPTITVEYDDSSWSVTDGGNKVANDVPVEVQYKTDKTFGIQTVDGKTAKIEVVDVGENPVNTGYTKNQDGSITFNKVSQPLKLKVTFEDVELPPAPEECDASFFFHAGGNNYFPAHSFDGEGKAIMGPLVGKVENNQVKTEPDNDQLKAAIKNYYHLTDAEMVGVTWKWNEVKGHGDEGGLECLSCPYHVDGVALDKEGNPLKVKYSITYKVDGKDYYTVRLDEGTENTHAGVPTPTKPGYDFAGWKLVTEGADGTSVSQDLTYEATWTEKPSYDASFFFHAGGNNYFPAHSFDGEGKAIMGPLVGKVENNQVKTEPNNDQLKSAIQDYYRLTDDEMIGVKWEWNVVKGHGDEGGLECLSCPYHVDGVALDKDGNPLKVKYSITYKVDGKDYYTVRLDEGTENTHAGVPTPTKLGYDFAGWKLVTEGADGTSVSQDLTYEATWTEKPSYDASFFIKPDGVGAPNDPNGVFPENEFLPNGEAHKGLKGEVYGTATGNDAVKKAIKSEPKREDIINIIKDAYQLDAQEELAVNFRWYVIKSVNDDCNYHVDGVPVLDKDTENERVLKRYKITYQDDAGNVLYSTRANAGEDIPGYVGDTPTKDGYKFAGWESSSEDGKVHGHLTLTPKWEDNGNGGNTGGNGGNNGGNTGGNGGNNGGNTGGNGGQLPPDQNLEDSDNNGNGGNGNGEGGNGNGGNGGDSQKPLPGDKELANDKTNTGTDVPKTGDTGMNALVLNLMLLSISAMAGAVLCIRRKITKR